MALGPGFCPSGPNAFPNTILCPVPASPTNVRSSTHLTRAFIEATYRYNSPHHSASGLSTFKTQCNRRPGETFVASVRVLCVRWTKLGEQVGHRLVETGKKRFGDLPDAAVTNRCVTVNKEITKPMISR